LEYQQHISRLKTNAAHCRKLANLASDPDVKQALLEVASDIDAAIPMLDEHARRNDDD
jgi:hypothetical protein